MHNKTRMTVRSVQSAQPDNALEWTIKFLLSGLLGKFDKLPRRILKARVMTSFVAMILLTNSAYAAIAIASATWSDGTLTVRGSGSARANISISNAATNQAIGQTTASRNGSWSFRRSLRQRAVPCSVRATSSAPADGSMAIAVSNAPSNCVGTGPTPTPTPTPSPSPSPTPSAVPNASINSTSTDSLASVLNTVSQAPSTPVGTKGSYSVLAVNDLGMHCVDNDTRVVNILPPFQVLLGQVVQKGARPGLNPTGIDLFYSAAANPKDPSLGQNLLNGKRSDGTTFKTNFWWNVQQGGYDAFYPAGVTLSTSGLMAVDKGLPVPNTEKFYLETPATLEISQQLMPGNLSPYLANDAQKVNERYSNKPFFINFPFGYVADHVNWYEAAGIPMAPFDDFGRQNPYPLVKVQAKQGSNTLASVDAVLPVSAESSCINCHGSTQDVAASAPTRRSTAPIDALAAANLPVASSANDPDQGLPSSVSIEYGTDINILRLHDLKHGSRYVDPAGISKPCVIDGAKPNGDANCLTYQAYGVAESDRKPVVCQSCHYTPALDLLQVGPKNENGRNQLAHKSNSNVMHSHHGGLSEGGKPLFTAIPRAQQAADGSISNQAERLQALEQNCYQCHPGKDTKCLRGAMFNGGVLCSDCHGDMKQIGNDFTREVSVDRPMPGALANTLMSDFYTNPETPRVPWANEPGCGSCHTGDATQSLAAAAGSLVNIKDHNGVVDNIRLRQAFLTGDAKATPIVPSNKRFAEPVIPGTSQTGKPNAGAGNPQLYRVSTGHGGVMCEGCHGPTHAEWPVANNDANDNQTAIQLQGHVGFISECSTCHTSGSPAADTQNGPHGMHVVNDSRFWSEAHKDLAERENSQPGGGTCAACHGSDHRGTVLSRVPADRTFRVEGRDRVVKAGQPVACDLCHSLDKSFDN